MFECYIRCFHPQPHLHPHPPPPHPIHPIASPATPKRLIKFRTPDYGPLLQLPRAQLSSKRHLLGRLLDPPQARWARRRVAGSPKEHGFAMATWLWWSKIVGNPKMASHLVNGTRDEDLRSISRWFHVDPYLREASPLAEMNLCFRFSSSWF